VELAERLAVAHPDVPVLFMTGYVDLTSREGLVGADVLIKPFVITELVARVEEALDRASAARRFTPTSEASAQGSKR
jgi:DNA-binding response OmpR family regulator